MGYSATKIAIYGIVILFFIVMLVLGPILTIWSLNLLFGLSIPVTIKTFFATMWLCMVLGARTRFNRS